MLAAATPLHACLFYDLLLRLEDQEIADSDFLSSFRSHEIANREGDLSSSMGVRVGCGERSSTF